MYSTVDKGVIEGTYLMYVYVWKKSILLPLSLAYVQITPQTNIWFSLLHSTIYVGPTNTFKRFFFVCFSMYKLYFVFKFCEVIEDIVFCVRKMHYDFSSLCFI